MSHGGRQFIDVAQNFPQECQHVLERLGEVYQHEAQAKKAALSPEARLRFHQERSQKIMDEIHQWMSQRLEQKLVEPNSGLGQAFGYMLRHWDPLTLFLRQAGAPLDNNICERALKMAILHRKNSMGYKTQNGARLGDMFMSLIHTCRLCAANPLDYLNELQRHANPTSRIRACKTRNLLQIKAPILKVCTTPTHLAVAWAAVIFGGGCAGNGSFNFSSNNCWSGSGCV